VDQADRADKQNTPEPGVPRTVRRRRWLRVAGAAFAIALLWLTWSVGGALTAPGTDSVPARLAEWARNNDLGFAVDAFEQVQYDLSPPAIGGSVAGGIPMVSPDIEAAGGSTAPSASEVAGNPPAQPTAGDNPVPAASAGPGTANPAPTSGPSTASIAPTSAATPQARPTPRPTPGPTPSPTTAAPDPIASQVEPALPSEGAWQTLVSLHGQPAMRVAFLRPDPSHTSYLDAVVWFDQRLVRFVLHPGYQQPGGSGWSQPDQVSTSERGTILATFNSAFRVQDADGGYWADGIAAAPLRQGAASMVVYKDGRVDIVKWGTAAPGADVAAVRQNLVLLVDNGVVSPLVDNPSTAAWGTTYTTLFYVWRTALGIRADGSLVFVIGPALNVGSLARILHAAGAVRAIELDINPSWTHFMTYTHPSPGEAVPHLLTQDELNEPYRYLQPSSRDFVAVLPRI
jgi:hypothetical protein